MNLSVKYIGPDGMSKQLLEEVQSRFGARAQNKGFVTGYMNDARAGITGGHFADKYGITHAVDIGVDIELDGSGLLPKDALWLAEHLRELGSRGKHPFSRRGYLIHDMSTTRTPQPRIAGFHTGWKWQVYTGASPHSDHIHVTTGGDQQWGGEPQLPPHVYNSRQSWEISSTVKGGSPVSKGSMRPAPDMYPITQRYSQNATAYNSSGKHGAIDYGVPVGTPLVAPDDGVVVYDGWAWDLPGGPNDWHLRWYLIKPARGDTKGGGGIITVFRNENGAYWGLSHASQSFFHKGDRVRRGQVIQISGSTGIVTGPHTHVNLWPSSPNWSNGAYGAIDPEPWIKTPYSPLSPTSWSGSPTAGKGTGSKKFDFLEWLAMASQKEINRALDAWATSENGKAAIGSAVLDRKFKDSQGRRISLAYVLQYEKSNWDLVRSIANAVRPSIIARSVWSFRNERINGKKDAYQLLTDAQSTTNKETNNGS